MERWLDVGPLLRAAQADMKVGQLITGEAFSLFEAMSALEAGNPKMDAAASPAADRPSLEALLDDPAAVPVDLGAADALAVMDGLLAAEASWHSGGSPMQTVYASLYMLRLDRLKEHDSVIARALYAYCLTLQCDCSMIRDLVISGMVCEEEDINVFTSGIPFEQSEGGPAAALEALDAAIGAATAIGAQDAEPASAALACRLQLRRALHLGLCMAAASDPEEARRSAEHFAEARSLLPALQSSASGEASATPPGFYVDVNRHLLGPAPPRQVQLMPLSDAVSYMERMLDHLQLAVAVSEHVFDYRSLQLYLWRFARQRPGAIARSMLHLLITPSRWEATAAPGGNGPASNGPEQAHSHSQSQSQPPVAEGKSGGRGGRGRRGAKGQATSSDHPSSATAAAGPGSTAAGGPAGLAAGPAWVPSKAMVAAACQVAYGPGLPDDAELFLEQALIAVSNWCQAVLMNRCRSRRRLRRCLDDWLNMYHHGVNADVVPAFQEYLRATGWRWRPLDGASADDGQGPLGTWVEYETCATMLHHLLMGFELELYEPHEYDMIYWYCDYLSTSMVTAFSAIHHRRPPAQVPKLPQQGAAGLGGRGLGRGLGGRGRGGLPGGDSAAAAKAAAEAAVARYEKSQNMMRFDLLEVETMQYMCQGLLRLMAGLKLAGGGGC
ncbi:N-alpha-acetyltransferase, 35 NatC auxiliary subunit [Tetrabaena socialis]|uniref:N-alpha-acetyltransferase, 35 NatC auxiliary subunit n=1 Tax=Tetrabaena socialis TaxID=47790 RepID=A0A2J8A6B2_9CHLO|nr:N-alpha-acetyltransferase, 35 NatC auxiliary subunit [Tetrabaena socialis]|eukprot:PNH08064.1 N-alpha-acetyltransferase, 35 NatC auxiliary subunit [Tetrabaena socialis]